MKQTSMFLVVVGVAAVGVLGGCCYVAPSGAAPPETARTTQFGEIGWTFPVTPAREAAPTPRAATAPVEPLRTPVLTQFSPRPPLPDFVIREPAKERPRPSLSDAVDWTRPAKKDLALGKLDLAVATSVEPMPEAAAPQQTPAPVAAAPFAELPRWHAELRK